jgi:hypothetical protein
MASNPGNGNGAYPNEMRDELVFMDAVRAAVPVQPDPRLEATLVPRLAATARASTLEAETAQLRRGTIEDRRPRSRRALLARVAIAVALIPLVLAGLAVAGVTVPSPARSAFDSVGINLPNQPADHSQKPPTATNPESAPVEQGGNDVSNAAEAKPKGKGGNSAAAHKHARKQHEKAQGKAKGHDRGKAVGLNEATPPGQSGQTGPPPHSNAGGSSGSSSSGKAPMAPPAPKGVANGQTKVPPGRSK